METIIQNLATDHVLIEFVGDGPAQAWKLCVDYNALAKIETATGMDIRKIDSWAGISNTNFTQIVWGCLARYSPEVTLEDVRNQLHPQIQTKVGDAILLLTFPELAEAMAKHQAGASPNEQPGTKTT